MLSAIDLEGCQPAGPYQRDLSRTFGQGMAESRVIDGHAWWIPSYAPVTANSNYIVSTDTLADRHLPRAARHRRGRRVISRR